MATLLSVAATANASEPGTASNYRVTGMLGQANWCRDWPWRWPSGGGPGAIGQQYQYVFVLTCLSNSPEGENFPVAYSQQLRTARRVSVLAVSAAGDAVGRPTGPWCSCPARLSWSERCADHANIVAAFAGGSCRSPELDSLQSRRRTLVNADTIFTPTHERRSHGVTLLGQRVELTLHPSVGTGVSVMERP